MASVSRSAPETLNEKAISASAINLKVEYGDFSDALRKSRDALLEAEKYAANDHQRNMLAGYAKRYCVSFCDHRSASFFLVVALRLDLWRTIKRLQGNGSRTSDPSLNLTSVSSRYRHFLQPANCVR